MILVGQFDSPVTRRIGITPNLYGMPYERDTRSVFGDAATFAQINPLTRIPALILDDGAVLIDSNAICDWLDEGVDKDRALIPRSGLRRRQILQDIAVMQGTFEKIVGIVYERHFHRPEQNSPAWIDRCTT